MGDSNPTDNSYYSQGSGQIKASSSATLRKLEVRSKLTVNATRLVIVLVGLPGRGKSFISRKLQAYFSWQCIPCKIFNVGKYRRDANAVHRNLQDEKKEKDNLGACDADFFDSKNEAAKKLREEVAMIALTDALDWLDSIDEDVRLGGGRIYGRQRSSSISDSISWNENGMKSKIAIFDATNSTRTRRETIIKKCTDHEMENGKPVGVVFIESVCDDQDLLDENYRMKISVSPDYQGMSEEEALADCRERVRKYEEAYETIDDDSLSYIKLFNLSSKILANQIYGRMSKAVVPALMAWHIGNRPIYLCRPGKTEAVTRIGRLGEKGCKFRDALSNFFHTEAMNFLQQQGQHNQKYNTGTSMRGGRKSCIDNPGYLDQPMRTCPGKILCSTTPRAVETASWDDLTLPMDILSNLNPLDKGDFSGKELNEIKELDPVWYSMLENDPYNTRFPGGECYHDLINRLESCVIDMEQQVVPVLVVSHVSVIQVLLSYFRNSPIEKCTGIEVPMNTVIKLTPVNGGGWTESQICILQGRSLDKQSSSIGPSTTPIWTDFVSFEES